MQKAWIWAPYQKWLKNRRGALTPPPPPDELNHRDNYALHAYYWCNAWALRARHATGIRQGIQVLLAPHCVPRSNTSPHRFTVQ